MRKTSIILKAAVMVAMALQPVLASSQTVRGDFNMDGRVNIGDVTAMIGYLLGGSPGHALPDCRDTLDINGVPLVMVKVQGGTYMRQLGTSWSVDDFSIGETEVTIELWNAVMGDTPKPNMMSIPQHPVEHVSWNDCQAFIAELNALTGLSFRLPTESEWEYAACGGRLTLAYTYSGGNDLNDVGWYRDNRQGQDPSVPHPYLTVTSPVATKAPNELGLYDMSGNVAEWCYSFREASGVTDYSPLRGGSVDDAATGCTMTSVTSGAHDKSGYYIGFRLAL